MTSRGRYTFVELPPYKYETVPRVYHTDSAWKVWKGLLCLRSDTGLTRNLEASHFLLVTPVSQRLFPGLRMT